MRVMLAAFILMSAGTRALAADAAERQILGFSPDSRYFAFEQYGTEDGSGFPYSDIFIMNTQTDSWIDGSPVRVRLADESATVASARDQSRNLASKLLGEFRIGEPGILFASQSTYQKVSDPRQISFRTSYLSGGHTESISFDDQNVLTVTVQEFVLPSPSTCPVGDTPFAGFALKIRMGHEEEQEIYRDKQIPASRGCPVHYSLSDVLGHSDSTGAYRFIVLLSVYAFGFEGLDRRFLAIGFQ